MKKDATDYALPVILFIIAWIGHACLWCRLLNALYGMPITKKFLKPFRLFTGLMIVFGFPIVIAIVWMQLKHVPHEGLPKISAVNILIALYTSLCVLVGGLVLPFITFLRMGHPRPPLVVHEQNRRINYWPQLGAALLGDGPWRNVVRLPLNDPFTVEYTAITLKLESLPPDWEGLTILYMSDFHFYGTPTQAYFDAILSEIASQPVPDIVALGGDYVDALKYHAWLAPVLGRLKWKEAGLAILGNHDHHHEPDAIRKQLTDLGFKVLSDCTAEIPIRGLPCTVIGHEGPWSLYPAPEVPKASEFKLCLSHTPDNFYWAVEMQIDLMLCGHVHGGQIRLPLIGSIFCPSIYGRRFDQGVFEKERTVMVVSRGLSGKEPLRFRCPAQVLRLTLTGERGASAP